MTTFLRALKGSVLSLQSESQNFLAQGAAPPPEPPPPELVLGVLIVVVALGGIALVLWAGRRPLAPEHVGALQAQEIRRSIIAAGVARPAAELVTAEQVCALGDQLGQLADLVRGPSVEIYLESEHAVQDVAALLAMSFGCAAGFLMRSSRQAWTQVDLRGHGVIVYYRLDGDYYAVTDLGEAVRALRLRTGLSLIMPGTERNAVRNQMLRACGDSVIVEYWTLHAINDQVGGNPVDWFSISFADLPRAVVRVMRAAYRVARLEVSQ